MFRKLHHSFDPILTTGIVISVATAVILLLTGQGGIQGLLASLVVLIIAILIDIIARLNNAKEEIINSLKGVRVEVFKTSQDFSNAKFRLLLEADAFVYDTELSSPSAVSSTESKFRQLLNERVSKGEITYKYIRAVFTKSQFEQLLEWLFRFYRYNYYIGYFIGPQEVIPALNLMIFDRKHFLMGGYYGPSARGDDRNLYVEHDLMAETLEQYFDYLWSRARLFNEHRTIDWEQVQHCGMALGYTIEELNATISEIARRTGFKEIKKLSDSTDNSS